MQIYCLNIKTIFCLSVFCVSTLGNVSVVCKTFFAVASEEWETIDDGLDGQDEEKSSHINRVDR